MHAWEGEDMSIVLRTLDLSDLDLESIQIWTFLLSGFLKSPLPHLKRDWPVDRGNDSFDAQISENRIMDTTSQGDQVPTSFGWSPETRSHCATLGEHGNPQL
jgi:hypothetical protein